MLKTFLSASIVCILFFTACNNPATNQQPVVKDAEKQLKDDVAKYPDSFALKDKLIGYYQQNNDYKKALSETDSLLIKDSTDAALWNIKANLFFDNNDTTNAIHSLENAVQLSPNPEYIKSLGSLYAETRNPLALSVADFLFNNQQFNSREQAVFIKGLYYSCSGDKIGAINYFDTCLRMNYNDMFSYREKAMCLYSLNKYNDALTVLQKAITVNSTYDEAYYWMGRCYEKLDNKNDAIKSYQLALQLDKNYIEAKDALTKLGAN